MDVDENGRAILVARPVTAESQALAGQHLAIMEQRIAEYAAAGKRVPTEPVRRRDHLRGYLGLPFDPSA